jgi:hypothetical protein
MPGRLVTAVALYGPKTVAVRELLESVQGICLERLGGGFRPYAAEQIHATLIRLDGVADTRTGLIVNQRYLELTGQRRAMDLGRALEILTHALSPPLRIGIGGYPLGAAAVFSSRGEHPHERSFSAQAGALVLLGWPAGRAGAGRPNLPLDTLRRKMSEANVAHFYHRRPGPHPSPGDVDNDFHLVVGHYDVGQQAAAEQAVSEVRGYLAGHPVEVEVGPGQVSVVASYSPTLMPARFAATLPVAAARIVSLYR